MTQLFDIPEIRKKSEYKCKHCQHIFFQEYQNMKVFYCNIQQSRRTANGHLKIKCNMDSCQFFKAKE